MIEKIVVKEHFNVEKFLERKGREIALSIADFLEKDLRRYMGLEFYTLEELKRKKHPYAQKHFGGRVTVGAVVIYKLMGFRHKGVRLDVISRRKGGFDRVVKKQIFESPIRIGKDLVFGRVFFDVSSGPYYVRYVVLGTRKLIPRPLPYIYLLQNYRRLMILYRKAFVKGLGLR